MKEGVLKISRCLQGGEMQLSSNKFQNQEVKTKGKNQRGWHLIKRGSIKLIEMNLIHGHFLVHQEFDHGLCHEGGACKIDFHLCQLIGV